MAVTYDTPCFDIIVKRTYTKMRIWNAQDESSCCKYCNIAILLVIEGINRRVYGKSEESVDLNRSESRKE